MERDSHPILSPDLAWLHRPNETNSVEVSYKAKDVLTRVHEKVVELADLNPRIRALEEEAHNNHVGTLPHLQSPPSLTFPHPHPRTVGSL